MSAGKKKESDIAVILKWAIPIFICIGVLVITGFVCSVLKSPDGAVLAEQANTIKTLRDELDIKNNQYHDLESLTASYEELNVYTGAADPNDAIASDFFKHYCTWQDGEVYESLRDELMGLGYDENSTVVNCFLPEQDITYDTEGHIQYSIDTNLSNMSFESLTAYRLYVDGATSYYAGIVQLSTEDWTGGAVGNNVSGVYAYVTYSVTDGQIFDVEAYALYEA